MTSPSAEPGGPPEISACLLCYNDAPTIVDLVESCAAALDRAGVKKGEIVVVDDGSTDDSRQTLRVAEAREPRLRVIEHPQNRGYGAAMRSVFAAARGEWVFYTDGDGQYDPGELVLLAANRSGCDVVQGYKRSRSDPLSRRVVGEAYRVVVGRAFALPIRDVDCDFRLIRRSVLRELDLRRNSGAICVELVRKLAMSGARFTEVEVSHYERRAGESQFFTPRKVSRALGAVTWLWLTLVLIPFLRKAFSR